MTTYTITVTDHGDVAAVADGGTATITVTEGTESRLRHLTFIPGAEPAAAPDAGDNRLYVDTAEDDLLRQVDTDGVNQPHWPVYVIPHGGTVPVGLAPHTIILEEGV